jgi:hypothetical protein
MPNILNYKSKRHIIPFYFNLLNKYSIQCVSPTFNLKFFISQSATRLQRSLLPNKNEINNKYLISELSVNLSWFFYIYKNDDKELIDLYYNINNIYTNEDRWLRKKKDIISLLLKNQIVDLRIFKQAIHK